MSESSKNDCIFCKIIAGSVPREVVYEDEYTFAFPTNRPESPGHILVVPKHHCVNLFDCPPDILSRVMTTVQKLARNHKSVRIMQNNHAPLQTIFHLHFHIIPYDTEAPFFDYDRSAEVKK